MAKLLEIIPNSLSPYWAFRSIEIWEEFKGKSVKIKKVKEGIAVYG